MGLDSNMLEITCKRKPILKSHIKMASTLIDLTKK